MAPEAVVTVSAFRYKAVDVGVPLQVSAEGMEDHDKSGREVLGLVHLEKHA